MKKINRKGFTLVELLAVIVILAIVVGITLVTVLPVIKDSKQQAFELTAQTAADYLEKKYQLSMINDENICGYSNIVEEKYYDMEASCITSAGLKPENYVRARFMLKATGRFCVNFYAYTKDAKNKNALNLAKTDVMGEYSELELERQDGVRAYTKESSETKVGITTMQTHKASSSGC